VSLQSLGSLCNAALAACDVAREKSKRVQVVERFGVPVKSDFEHLVRYALKCGDVECDNRQHLYGSVRSRSLRCAARCHTAYPVVAQALTHPVSGSGVEPDGGRDWRPTLRLAR
jgi:hypothetical protein